MPELKRIHAHRLLAVLASCFFIWASNVYFDSMFGYDALGMVRICVEDGDCRLSYLNAAKQPAWLKAVHDHQQEKKRQLEKEQQQREKKSSGTKLSPAVATLNNTASAAAFPIESNIWLSVSLFFMVMTAWSYAKCVFTDPGRVPKIFEFASRGIEGRNFASSIISSNPSSGVTTPRGELGYSSSRVAPGVLEEGGVELSLTFMQTSQPCMLCNLYKPQRAHHCSVCERCILRYDHHCPWIANCVGYRNMKYFLLFLFYFSLYSYVITMTMGRTMFLALLYRYAATGHPLAGLAGKTAKGVEHLPAWSHGGPSSHQVLQAPNFILFWAAFIISTGTIWLLRKQWFLTINNITTIEAVLQGTTRFKSPYDLGQKKNLEQVFGKGPFWKRWFPVAPYRGNVRDPGAIIPSKKDATSSLVSQSYSRGGYGTIPTCDETSHSEQLRQWLLQEGAMYDTCSSSERNNSSSPSINRAAGSSMNVAAASPVVSAPEGQAFNLNPTSMSDF